MNQGFALLQVLLLTSMFGGIVYVVTTVGENQSKLINYQAQKNEIEAVTEDIRFLLSDIRTCSVTFRNTIIKAGQNKVLKDVKSIIRVFPGADEAAWFQKRYQVSSKSKKHNYGNIPIRIKGYSISIKNENKRILTYKRGLREYAIGFVHIHIEKRGKSLGSKYVLKKIPVEFYLNKKVSSELEVTSCRSYGKTYDVVVTPSYKIYKAGIEKRSELATGHTFCAKRKKGCAFVRGTGAKALNGSFDITRRALSCASMARSDIYPCEMKLNTDVLGRNGCLMDYLVYCQ